jgi:hypothetical protein
MRRKGVRVGYCRSAAGIDATREKRWDAELAAYRAARAEGIQPDGTTMDKNNAAKQASDKSGEAYGGT